MSNQRIPSVSSFANGPKFPAGSLPCNAMTLIFSLASNGAILKHSANYMTAAAKLLMPSSCSLFKTKTSPKICLRRPLSRCGIKSHAGKMPALKICVYGCSYWPAIGRRVSTFKNEPLPKALPRPTALTTARRIAGFPSTPQQRTICTPSLGIFHSVNETRGRESWRWHRFRGMPRW